MAGLILVTGSEGLVGSRFIEISESRNIFHTPSEIEMDITKPAEVKAIIGSYDFRAVVNFAAFTNVSEAEKQRGNKNGDCWKVNVEGVKNLVEGVEPHKERVHFIQISSDMVFSGSEADPGPYTEKHELEKDSSKLTWYGYTKAEGERAMRKVLGDPATILRINYPVRISGSPDFLRRMLALYDVGNLYPLMTDQHISLTFIDEICRALDKIIAQRIFGTFHASSRDTTTPYELFSFVLGKTRGTNKGVKKTTHGQLLKETNMPAYRYPKFGGLKVNDTEKVLGTHFSTWKEIVDKLVIQGLGKNL